MRWDSATRYQILLKINNAIITKTSRESLFQALATELRKHISYDRLSINLYDADSQSLSYFATADGINPEGISSMESRPLDTGAISRMVIQSGQTVIIDDLSRYSDLPSVKSMITAGLNATMAFLLTVRDRMLGTLHFSFSRKPDHLSEMVDTLTDISKQVAIAVDNMLAYTHLMRINENLELEKRYLIDNTEEYQRDIFFYTSAAMIKIIDLVEQVAVTDASVLLTGETGTGKDYLARYLHKLSPRRDHLFVKINSPALVPSLFESELFGHARGAFTGANSHRVGRFEMANGGTIFLDEVGELSSNLQGKLLHVLQDRRFERVGDSRPIETNFRVIAATNKDLSEEIRLGKFRQDLYYRLNIINIHVPPLRERTRDIPYLIENLTILEAKKTNRPAPVYAQQTLDCLIQYHWPGNVRELKNLVKRMVILRSGELITPEDIHNMMLVVPPQPHFDSHKGVSTLVVAERDHIERALIKCRGVIGGQNGAARLLGLPRSTLQYRLKKAALNPADYTHRGPN